MRVLIPTRNDDDKNRPQNNRHWWLWYGDECSQRIFLFISSQSVSQSPSQLAKVDENAVHQTMQKNCLFFITFFYHYYHYYWAVENFSFQRNTKNYFFYREDGWKKDKVSHCVCTHQFFSLLRVVCVWEREWKRLKKLLCVRVKEKTSGFQSFFIVAVLLHHISRDIIIIVLN